jgi:hypothetical protein
MSGLAGMVMQGAFRRVAARCSASSSRPRPKKKLLPRLRSRRRRLRAGAAMGTGSAMAHRAVDSVMGPRTMHVEAAPAAEGAAPMSAAQPVACANQMKAFNECLGSSQGSIANCQVYFDALQQCKTNGF